VFAHGAGIGAACCARVSDARAAVKAETKAEAIMLYKYGDWIIDATPDYSFGRFFARARLTRASSDNGEEPEMHIQRDIAWFEREDQAVQCAHQWAIRWIDKRGGTLPDAQAKPVNRAMPSKLQPMG
jgi:hypothetical protein